jgi:ATP-dependent exoDNAse (exonuclease V) alpha subunit
MVKNRDHWTITDIHHDRSVTVTGRTGTTRLPAQYVAQHLELGYAQTSHATQGRTVDTALLLIDTPTDSRGIYTLMTRGREANHAYVAVEGNQAAIDALTQAIKRDWIDQPAIERRTQLNQPQPGATEPVGENAQRAAIEAHIRNATKSRRAQRMTADQ